jgi:hypothetical protein
MDGNLPAETARIIAQIEAERPYVTNLTSFSFTYYQSPRQSGVLQYYDEYKAYVDARQAGSVH